MPSLESCSAAFSLTPCSAHCFTAQRNTCSTAACLSSRAALLLRVALSSKYMRVAERPAALGEASSAWSCRDGMTACCDKHAAILFHGPCSAAAFLTPCNLRSFAAQHNTCSSVAYLSSKVALWWVAERLAAAGMLRMLPALHGVGEPRWLRAFTLPSLSHLPCSAAVS